MSSPAELPVCVRGGDLETNLVLGPTLFGLVFAYFLLGTLVLQIYLYYLNFRKSDNILLQSLVYFLLICELLHTGFSTATVFQQLISGFGDPLVAKGVLGEEAVAVPILDGIISIFVQSFFVWRIWILGSIRLRWIRGLCVVIMLLALLQLISVIITAATTLAAIKSTAPVEAASFLAITTKMITVWSSSSLVCDVVIAITMTSLLVWFKKETNYRKTDDILTKILRLTVQTGVATAICPIIQLPLFLVFPNSSLGNATVLVVGKIYTNSLLANLNARTPATAIESTDYGLKSIKFSNPNHGSSHPAVSRTTYDISSDSTVLHGKSVSLQPGKLERNEYDYTMDTRGKFSSSEDRV